MGSPVHHYEDAVLLERVRCDLCDGSWLFYSTAAADAFRSAHHDDHTCPACEHGETPAGETCDRCMGTGELRDVPTRIVHGELREVTGGATPRTCREAGCLSATFDPHETCARHRTREAAA